MKKSIWYKRIPTFLGLIAIFAGIIVTSFFTKNLNVFEGNASPTENPQNITVTNISDTTFTVSYETDTPLIGSLIYGTDKEEKQTALDDRDNGGIQPHKLHYITVKNLSPNTHYFYSIVSGRSTFSAGTNPFEISTTNTIQSPLTSKSISGKVILADGSPATEGIVLAHAQNTQDFSTLLNPDGSFTLNLSFVLNKTLDSYADLSNSTLQITIEGDDASSHVTVSTTQSQIPTITLSKDYDFTVSQNPIASSSASFGFPTLLATEAASVEISTPKQGQSFTDSQPQFKGTAKPGSVVKITIHSDALNTQTVSDQNGNWTFRPSSPLSPGEHTITITAPDLSGVLKTITQSFTVFASGTQVGQSATPSATITFTPTPTLTPTPTAQVIATPTVTPIPALILTPTQIITPTKAQLPESGDSSAVTGGIGALVTTVVGVLLFF